MLSVVTIGLLVVLARVVGLAYLDVTAFPAFAPTYLASAYAAALMVAVAVALGRTVSQSDGERAEGGQMGQNS
jgi:hypothetical protein